MRDDPAPDGRLDAATVREQFERVVFNQWDDEAFIALMTRYLSQPLSDSESAWASMNLANALAVGGRAADAVRVHEDFERWLPGRSPRLSRRFPHYPSLPEVSQDQTMGADEIRVHFLGQSVEFATAYAAIERYADYVAKAAEALARLTPIPENLEGRFYSVRIYMNAAEVAGDFDRAERYLLAMHAIAAEATDPELAANLHATTLMSEIQVAQGRSDESRHAEKMREAFALLEEADRTGPSNWLRGYRHELAHHLTRSGRYDLALPMLDAILATGDHFGGGYGWLMHAAAVWRVTRDRPRALALLRQARDHDGRDLVDEFRSSSFEDVHDDPEFLEAISRKPTATNH